MLKGDNKSLIYFAIIMKPYVHKARKLIRFNRHTGNEKIALEHSTRIFRVVSIPLRAIQYWEKCSHKSPEYIIDLLEHRVRENVPN